MPRLGFGLPLVSSTQESPITLIEDLLWEDIDTNNNLIDWIKSNYHEDWILPNCLKKGILPITPH